MFIIVRIIICCVFFLIPLTLMRLFGILHRNRTFFISIMLSIVVLSISSVVPFENLLFTFNTPEEVYLYSHIGKHNIVLIVEGNNSALVIDQKNNKDYLFYMVPKDDQGWKIGIGTDMKYVSNQIIGELAINVYQFKCSDDYYIQIDHIHGTPLMLADEYNSCFYPLKRIDYFGKENYSYFACVQFNNSKYSIIIDGIDVCIALND